MKKSYSLIVIIILLISNNLTFSQSKIIGKVIDEEFNETMPFANVLVKGTNIGVTTDFDGNYSINASKGAVLQYSFMGMQTVEKTYSDSNIINLIMVENAEALNEVVVTAFGSKRQAKSLGYAATKVSSAELTEVSTSNPLESLSGKVAGVDISAPAQPGASTKVIFRGFSSITGSNSPLYLSLIHI